MHMQPQPGQHPCEPLPPPHPKPKKKKRRRRFMSFVRGYLMFVGSLTTIYVLIQLLVLLFIEIGKWMPTV